MRIVGRRNTCTRRKSENQLPCKREKNNNKHLTEQMTFAHVGIHIKHVAGEITESENVIALCSVDGQHIVSEFGRVHVFLRPGMGQHRIQCNAELTSLRLAGLDIFQEQHCTL